MSQSCHIYDSATPFKATCIHRVAMLDAASQSCLLTPVMLQQLWRYNKHAVEMRIDHLNSMTGAATEAQTVMVNDIPEVNKVSLVPPDCAHAFSVDFVVAANVIGCFVGNTTEAHAACHQCRMALLPCNSTKHCIILSTLNACASLALVISAVHMQ